MIVAMLLAHLVGDYVLQWDRLAYWKSRALSGVLVHAAIVTAVTALFALPFDPGFWPWVLFIGGLHCAVDALPLWLLRAFRLKRAGLFELTRFLIDQAAHLVIIGLALTLSGYLSWETLAADVTAAVAGDRTLALLLGYTFAAMPAWILVEFLVYGLLNGSAPDFAIAKQYKYVGTLERWLITTCVLVGQFALVPLVALPRLLVETPQVARTSRALVYVAELLASVTLAVGVGLALRLL